MNFEKQNKRQPIVLGLLIIVGLILVWQLYALFANKNGPKIAATAPMAMSNVKPGTTVTLVATATQLAMATTPANTDSSTAVDPTTNSQAQYLRLVNEYQMAQLQRMIAEDNEAIAIAKQNSAKAMSETAKLMGTGSISIANNNNQANVVGYQLIYTGQQGDGQWTATIKKDGQNYDVITGKQLPDGFVVMSIDDNGVLLAHGNTKKLITFSGETIINNKVAAVTTTTEKPVVANTAATTVRPEPVEGPAKTVANPEKNSKEKTDVNNTPTFTAKLINEIKSVVDDKSTSEKPVVTAKASEQSMTATDKKLSAPALNVAATMEKDSPYIKTTQETLPEKTKEKLSPLQQPMVLFPHVANAKIAAVKTVVPAAASKDDQVVAMANATILTTNPNFYTIQLTSDHELENLQGFINKHNLKTKAQYFQTMDMQHRKIYILIYGQYPTMQAAQADLTKLPENAKSEGAFVVKFSTVQTLLKKAVG